MAEDRMLNDEILLGLIKANSGGGGGGTTDYEDLDNLPKIDGVELKGNKSLADLGIASAQSVENITNGESINNFAGVETALSNVQALDGVVDPSGSVGKDKNLYLKLSGSIPSAMKVTSLKFEVTARRGGGTGMIEYSRLGFYDAEGNKYSWPQGTTWSSNVQTAENDPIGNSKMLQYSIPAVTTINLPGGEYIDTSVYNLYCWSTGNYSGENCQRDPVSWKLYLSEDKTNYILRDVRSNQTITTNRNTLAFKDEFNTLPPEFPSISDIFYKKGGVWLKDAFAQQSEVDAIKDGQSIDSFSDVETALDGVETALATKQNATDNSLETDAKTIVGAINEHEGDVVSLKSGLTNLDNEVNGDATTYPYADVITIEDAVPANLADCSVKVEPVQDLHGYDKPWVGGAGKNKLPLVLAEIKTLNVDGAWSGNTYTHNGCTYDISTDDGGNITSITANRVGQSSSDSKLTIARGSLLESLQLGSAIINGISGGNSGTYFFYAYKVDNGEGGVYVVDGDLTVNCTPGDGANITFQIKSDYSAQNVKVYPMIRLSTETDSTFAPYTNICPISGHTEAVVTRDGKNYCEPNNYVSDDKDGTTYTDPVANGNITKAITLDAGTYKFSIKLLSRPNTDRSISFGTSQYGGQLWGLNHFNQLTVGQVYSSTVTLESKTTFRGYLYGSNGGTFKIQMQIERGDTVTEYKQFVSPKTYTIQLGDTIYGGTVDFDSGVMTVDHAFVTLTGAENEEWFMQSGDNWHQFYIGIPDSLSSADSISNRFQQIQFSDRGTKTGLVQYTDTAFRFALIDSELEITSIEDWKTWLASNNVQVLYRLATPTTIQLTPQQIQLLQGTNTLYASTGQISVTANGVSGAIGAVQTQVNATDAAVAQLAADIAEQLPDAPTTDGAYVLTVTVADGAATYSWESAE